MNECNQLGLLPHSIFYLSVALSFGKELNDPSRIYENGNPDNDETNRHALSNTKALVKK